MAEDFVATYWPGGGVRGQSRLRRATAATRQGDPAQVQCSLQITRWPALRFPLPPRTCSDLPSCDPATHGSRSRSRYPRLRLLLAYSANPASDHYQCSLTDDPASWPGWHMAKSPGRIHLFLSPSAMTTFIIRPDEGSPMGTPWQLSLLRVGWMVL